MAVRNCAEIGENLQKIVNRLIANDDLVKLLYYTESDPISKTNLTDEEKKDKVFNNLIRITPRTSALKNARSMVFITVDSGVKIGDNEEFRTVTLDIEVLVPNEQWFIRGTNLRPFAILGEIQKSLSGKTVNGLGKITGGDFVLSFITDEVTCYEATYYIVTYD